MSDPDGLEFFRAILANIENLDAAALRSAVEDLDDDSLRVALRTTVDALKFKAFTERLKSGPHSSGWRVIRTSDPGVVAAYSFVVHASDPDDEPSRPFVFPEEREPDVRVSATDLRFISARTRAQAVHWGFIALVTTIVLGLGAVVALSFAGRDANPLRELLTMIVGGELTLITGLLVVRER